MQQQRTVEYLDDHSEQSSSPCSVSQPITALCSMPVSHIGQHLLSSCHWYHVSTASTDHVARTTKNTQMWMFIGDLRLHSTSSGTINTAVTRWSVCSMTSVYKWK